MPLLLTNAGGILQRGFSGKMDLLRKFGGGLSEIGIRKGERERADELTESTTVTQVDSTLNNPSLTNLQLNNYNNRNLPNNPTINIVHPNTLEKEPERENNKKDSTQQLNHSEEEQELDRKPKSPRSSPRSPTRTPLKSHKTEDFPHHHIPKCWKSASFLINALQQHKHEKDASSPLEDTDENSMIHHDNCKEANNGGDAGADHNGTASWNRFLQCFSAFKPKKISSTTNDNLSLPTTGLNSTGDQLLQPKLKRNMTESDFFLYELASNSTILDYQDTKNLGKHLPPRAIGYMWELIFSTNKDGFSLHSIYRKMENVDTPVLLIIQDIEDRVFGAILSCGLRVSENFYGTGDTFLFRCRPEFEVFKWSGENFYFMQGQDRFVSVGSDNGRFGLWLDDNLYLGRTEQCSTFGNPPLVNEKDFKIKTLECWKVTI